MPESKTYNVPLTAGEMFYLRKAVREQVMRLLDEMQHLRLMEPETVKDFDDIEEALTSKGFQLERLESAIYKMMEAGAKNQNPYL